MLNLNLNQQSTARKAHTRLHTMVHNTTPNSSKKISNQLIYCPSQKKNQGKRVFSSHHCTDLATGRYKVRIPQILI